MIQCSSGRNCSERWNMRRGVVVALLMACAAGAGGGIWYQIALNRQQNNMSAPKRLQIVTVAENTEHIDPVPRLQ